MGVVEEHEVAVEVGAPVPRPDDRVEGPHRPVAQSPVGPTDGAAAQSTFGSAQPACCCCRGRRAEAEESTSSAASSSVAVAAIFRGAGFRSLARAGRCARQIGPQPAGKGLPACPLIRVFAGIDPLIGGRNAQGPRKLGCLPALLLCVCRAHLPALARER